MAVVLLHLLLPTGRLPGGSLPQYIRHRLVLLVMTAYYIYTTLNECLNIFSGTPRHRSCWTQLSKAGWHVGQCILCRRSDDSYWDCLLRERVAPSGDRHQCHTYCLLLILLVWFYYTTDTVFTVFSIVLELLKV